MRVKALKLLTLAKNPWEAVQFIPAGEELDIEDAEAEQLRAASVVELVVEQVAPESTGTYTVGHLIHELAKYPFDAPVFIGADKDYDPQPEMGADGRVSL